MKNAGLTQDYIVRARKRLSALKALMKEEAWADVVRESQEVVELALKALVRFAGIEVPRVHDVSDLLLKEKTQFPKSVQTDLAALAKISKTLRRDRELAYYGSEDLTPSEFYGKDEATQAQTGAIHVVEKVEKAILKR